MRTTKNMVYFQIDIANEKMKGTNKKIKLGSRYGYYALDLENENGGATSIRTGLSLGQVYDILVAFNELSYEIERAKGDKNE